jgi:hypothetical protein
MVVCAFAHEIIVGEQHIKLRIHAIEILSAFTYKRAPESQRVFVAALQQHNSVTRTILELV